MGVSPTASTIFETRAIILELNEIVSKLDILLPQLSEFIIQFNNFIVESNVNVITEADGALSLDVPASMSDDQAEFISKKVRIIDRLIITRSREIDDLLQTGSKLNEELKGQNSDFSSKILEKADAFKKLRDSHKH